MECVRNVTIDNTSCLQHCSGLLVTSYTQKDIENHELKKELNNLVSKLSTYFNEKTGIYKDMENSLKGLL